MAINHIKFGSTIRLARNRSTGEEFIVISLDLDTRRYLVRGQVDGVTAKYARVNGVEEVGEGHVDVSSVRFDDLLARRLFRQYCASHPGIDDGTHIVRKTKAGMQSVQKDPSFKDYAQHVGPCENCGCDMHLKHNSKGQPFYGCSAYHRAGCRGTRRFEDPSAFSSGDQQIHTARSRSVK